MDWLLTEGNHSKYVGRFGQDETMKKAFFTQIAKEIVPSDINQTQSLEDVYKYICCLEK